MLYFRIYFRVSIGIISRTSVLLFKNTSIQICDTKHKCLNSVCCALVDHRRPKLKFQNKKN